MRNLELLLSIIKLLILFVELVQKIMPSVL